MRLTKAAEYAVRNALYLLIQDQDVVSSKADFNRILSDESCSSELLKAMKNGNKIN